eukprot:14470895-Alexandrium_andersonii.AAC.1
MGNHPPPSVAGQPQWLLCGWPKDCVRRRHLKQGRRPQTVQPPPRVRVDVSQHTSPPTPKANQRSGSNP